MAGNLKAFKGCLIAVGVLVAVVVLWGVSVYRDFPPRFGAEAARRIGQGWGKVSNPYFMVGGLGQGSYLYYRFDATPEAVLSEIAILTDKGMEEIKVTDSSPEWKRFQDESPYWWNPVLTPSTRCFGYADIRFVCDTATGRCYYNEK